MSFFISPPKFDIVKNLVNDFGGNFTAWNTWYSAQPPNPSYDTITLFLPTGTYSLFGFSPVALSNLRGVITSNDSATTNLNTAWITGAGLPLGVYPPSTNPQPRFATALAGATSITLLNIADAARFTTGYIVCLMGMCLQNSGYPQNNHFFELNTITNIVGAVLTMETPLVNYYSQDWPDFPTTNPTSQPDRGGAACIFPILNTDDGNFLSWPVLNQAFDQEIVIRNLTIEGTPNPNDNFNTNTKSALFEDCHFPQASPTPQTSKSWIMRRCDVPSQFTEVDKILEYLEFDTCTLRDLRVQSSSTNMMVVTDTTVTTLGMGCTKNNVFTRCTTPRMDFNPTFFGCSETVRITDCTISSIPANGIGGNGFNKSYVTLDPGGVLRFTRTNWEANDPGITIMARVVPGATFMMQRDPGPFRTVGAFKVLSLACEAGDTINGDILVSTTLPDPAPVWAASDINCYLYGPQLWVSNCDGCGVARSLSRGHPDGSRVYSYSNSGVYDGTDGQGTPSDNDIPSADGSPTHGFLTSITVSVTQAYTGAQSVSALRLFGRNGNIAYVTYADGTQGFWGADIDLSMVGTRTITPGSVTGAVGADSIPVIAAGPVWLSCHDPDLYIGLTSGGFARADFNSESPAVRPNIQVTIVVDPNL